MGLISFDRILKIVTTICNILLVAIKMLTPDTPPIEEDDVD